MSPELTAILTTLGRDPAYCQCECVACHQSRRVEKRATTLQALHTIMGQQLADSIIDDMGPHWAIVAALADPRGDGTVARKALVAISDAGIEFDRAARKAA